MKRGDIYRIENPSVQKSVIYRNFVVVSRQVVIDSKYSTVICAPVYSGYESLSSQVLIGQDEGLNEECSIHCDELVSLPKSLLTDFVGRISEPKIREVNKSIKVALDIFD